MRLRWMLGLVCLAAMVSVYGAAAKTQAGGKITSLTVTGTSARPLFTLKGNQLAVPPPNPKTSPSGQPLCPLQISGNAGLNYGTRFYVIMWDGQPTSTNAALYSA